jgi:hypothetical protein
MSQETPDFDYDGRLVFNGLRETTVNADDPENIHSQLLDDLPSFSRGSPNNQQKGFDEINLADIAEIQNTALGEDSPQVIDDELVETAETVIDRRYIWENYVGSGNREFVDEDGNSTNAWIRSTDEAYVYWMYPGFILIQGSQGKVEPTERRINAALGEDVDVENLRFDPDFFLWLLYRHTAQGKSISGPISVQSLSSSEVYGDLEQFGHRGRVEDSANIAESLPIIAALLQEMEFRMMEGLFSVNGFSLKIQIQTEGRIHVKVADAIDDAETRLKRVLLALLFVSEFVSLYKKWREDLPPTEQYPPFTFFDDLAGTAARNNAQFTFDVDDLIEYYEKKRGEKADPTNFTHL